jgi:hypothetical protein
VSNVDLILSYWAGEAIAHLIVSIGFDDGTRLAFSIQTRKSRGEEYSTIAGFFRQYELSIIAADERDVVRVRSNVRGEDVRIYRLRMPPMYAKGLLREYVAEANDVARSPRWYNTLTGNCTTLAFGMIRLIRPGTLPGSTTRRHRPMPIRPFLRKFARACRYPLTPPTWGPSDRRPSR